MYSGFVNEIPESTDIKFSLLTLTGWWRYWSLMLLTS